MLYLEKLPRLHTLCIRVFHAVLQGLRAELATTRTAASDREALSVECDRLQAALTRAEESSEELSSQLAAVRVLLGQVEERVRMTQVELAHTQGLLTASVERERYVCT